MSTAATGMQVIAMKLISGVCHGAPRVRRPCGASVLKGARDERGEDHEATGPDPAPIERPKGHQ
jgi:hypothetical protein